MTTTVTVTAHCDVKTRVHVERRFSDPASAPRDESNETTVLTDGESYQCVVYDDVSVTVREVTD